MNIEFLLKNYLKIQERLYIIVETCFYSELCNVRKNGQGKGDKALQLL